MPCFHPLDARRSPGGQIAFKAMTPFDTLIKLPCGRCIGCKLERSRQWAVRGMHEMKSHRAACSLLLTIRDSNYRPEDLDAYRAHIRVHESEIPADLTTGSNLAPDARLNSREYRSGGPVDSSAARTVLVPYEDGTRARPSVASPEGTGESLSIRDHQLFMKRLIRRLREAGPIEPVRFMMCGEYGEKLGRPHYHYIIFGYDFPDKYRFKKSRTGFQLYRSNLLESLWPYGHADIGECNFETIAYVARYVTKKITGEDGDNHYRRSLPDGTNYWLQPEFNAMSRNPGIGNKWFGKYASSVYPHDRVVINGKAAKPPRYYDGLLEKADPDRLEAVKKARQERAPNSEAQLPERLRAGEEITHARMRVSKRKLES